MDKVKETTTFQCAKCDNEITLPGGEQNIVSDLIMHHLGWSWTFSTGERVCPAHRHHEHEIKKRQQTAIDHMKRVIQAIEAIRENDDEQDR